MSRAWIGVDLDGTLAEYTTWHGVEHIGAPIPAMVTRVKRWLAEGKEVRIFTARVSGRRGNADTPQTEIEESTRIIQDWCEAHIGVRLTVTATKDFGMTVLYDDRCICVEKNTGRLLTPQYALENL
jgi:hypothetical protein